MQAATDKFQFNGNIHVNNFEKNSPLRLFDT